MKLRNIDDPDFQHIGRLIQHNTSSEVNLMRMHDAIVFAFLLLLSLPGSSFGGQAGTIDDSQLKNADRDAANWVMYGRTYDDHRFSPLKQINEQTISKLGLVWSRELGTTRGLEATPLVQDGIIYTTGSWSVVYALDA